MKDSEINEAQRHILNVLLTLAREYSSTISAQKLCDLSSIVLEHFLEGVPSNPCCPTCGCETTWFDDSGVDSGIPPVAVCVDCQNRWAP